MSSNSGKFLSYFINTFGTTVGISAIHVAITIITARYLGPSGKGALALTLLIPAYALAFGRLGIGHSINYYASKVPLSVLISSGIILGLILGLLFLFITIPCVYFLKDVFFKGIEIKMVIFICFTIPFLFYSEYLPCILQGIYKVKTRNLLFSISPLSNLFFLLVFVIILNLNLWGAIFSYAFALLISVSTSFYFVLKELKVKKITIDFNFMKKLIKYGLNSHVGNIFKQLSYRGNFLIISYFLAPQWVGYYVIATNVAEIMWKFPESIGTVLLPRVAQMNKQDAKAFTPLVCRTILLPMIISCIGILLLSDIIISFAFGKEFLPSVSVLKLLLPGIFSLAFWKILANDHIAQGHALKYSITSGIAFITMLSLDLLLIPVFGINGAAIASSISYIVATISIIFSYTRITGNPFKVLFIPTKSDFTFYKNLFFLKKIKIF